MSYNAYYCITTLNYSSQCAFFQKDCLAVHPKLFSRQLRNDVILCINTGARIPILTFFLAEATA